MTEPQYDPTSDPASRMFAQHPPVAPKPREPREGELPCGHLPAEHQAMRDLRDAEMRLLQEQVGDVTHLAVGFRAGGQPVVAVLNPEPIDSPMEEGEDPVIGAVGRWIMESIARISPEPIDNAIPSAAAGGVAMAVYWALHYPALIGAIWEYLTTTKDADGETLLSVEDMTADAELVAKVLARNLGVELD